MKQHAIMDAMARAEGIRWGSTLLQSMVRRSKENVKDDCKLNHEVAEFAAVVGQGCLCRSRRLCSALH